MAMVPVETNTGVRAGITEQALQERLAAGALNREYVATIEGTALLIVLVITLFGALWLCQRRTKIVAKIDELSVEGSAQAIRAARAASGKWKRFSARVKERADRG